MSVFAIRKGSVKLSLIWAVAAITLNAQQISAQPAAITACLDAFEDHPFSDNPEYRELTTGVKVFGIGQNTVDDKETSKPDLVYVTTAVNVMGGTTISLLNPNGWYCMRSNVNVMGGVKIKLACDAKFALIGDGATVLSNSDTEGQGTTVMGSTRIERQCEEQS